MEERKFCYSLVKIYILYVRIQEQTTDAFVIKQLEPGQTQRLAVC